MSNQGATAGVTRETAPAQDDFNTLYMAHQVHTLAQLVFQHVAASRQPSMAPWPAQPGPVSQTPQMTPAWSGACTVPGPVPGPHASSFFYWYP